MKIYRTLLLTVVWASLFSAGAAQMNKYSSYDAQANAILATMTLDEKIGQMTQPDFNGLKDPADVTKLFLGSVLNGGGSDPKAGNRLTDWSQIYVSLQERSLATRLRIPLLYGVDALHGHNNVIGAVIFPHNIGLGCTRNPKLVEQAARITAEEVRASGIHWSFAPCVTVPQDIRWGRAYEGFSESPEIVKTMGEAAVRGLQGVNLRDPLAVLACAKHFAGDGGTTFGTGTGKYPFDHGDTRVDEATLLRVHLQGYITAIRAGVGSIMPSFNSWNGVKCSGSKRLLTGILKGQLGFEGFLISDWDAIEELPGGYRAQIALSANAGMDMFMLSKRHREFITALKGLAADGTVPMSRIDDAVRRILRVKFAMGLMEKNWAPQVNAAAQKSFGSAAHRAVARECVRQSLVVLKNDRKVLPLKKGARVAVAGGNADDIGNQCGGWTIDWQGKSGPITEGTTILQAVRKAATVDAESAAVGIVVIGEKPYAEMFGDRTELPKVSAEDVAAVRKMKQKGIPVVVLVVSGRPLILDEILPMADAVVAAWLPGTEGDGVADVLFGQYKPTGKLSFGWGKAYPFGHGLSY